MKKTFLITLFTLFSASILFAQNQDAPQLPQNEVKINAFNLIAFSFVDVQYEYLLNEEASIGIGLLFNVGDDDEFLDQFRQFSLTPYYRQYFSNSYAKGFL